MTCERIQELILTDYLDGQLRADQKKHIDLHIKECAACAAFLQTAKAAAFEPFATAPQVKPPESVWMSIKESIEQEQRAPCAPSRWESILENLKTFVLPRPAMALAVLLMVVTVGGAIQLKMQQHVKMISHNGSYSDVFKETPIETSLQDGRGYDTTVEQYFL